MGVGWGEGSSEAGTPDACVGIGDALACLVMPFLITYLGLPLHPQDPLFSFATVGGENVEESGYLESFPSVM